MNASPNEWTSVDIALDAHAQLEVDIPTNDDLVIGSPRLTFKGTTLATKITRSEAAMTLVAEDIPEGAMLHVPIRARTPIQSANTAFIVQVGSDSHRSFVTLNGSAEFVAPRCRWVVNGAITLAKPKKAMFRLTNDGCMDAEHVQITVPKVPGIRLEIDGETRQLEGGGLAVIVKKDRIAVGERLDFPCTLTWLDPTVENVTLHARVTSATSAPAAFTLEVKREVNSAPSIAAKPRERETRLGEPIIVDVAIENGEVHTDGVVVTLVGDGIHGHAIELGALLPLEKRTFAITSHLTSVKHVEWTVPFSVELAARGKRLAIADGEINAKGSALLEASLSVGPLDRTLARELTAVVCNHGTGAAECASLQLKLPDGLLPVVDSLRVNGKVALSVDGSVSDKLAIDALAPGEDIRFSLRLRSVRALKSAIGASLAWDGVTAIVNTDAVDFPDARGRNAVDDLEQSPEPTQTVQEPETQPIAQHPASEETTRRTSENGASEQPAVTVTGESTSTGDDVAPGSAELPMLPTYRDSFTEAFNVLFPDDQETVALGRLVLGLYEFLPTSIPKADAELNDLRAAANEIVERYLPSVRNGTFGASGYALVSPRMAHALRVLRERLGEPPIKENSDRAALLAAIELADAAGELQESIRGLRSFVTKAVSEIPDEESLGNPVNVREVVA